MGIKERLGRMMPREAPHHAQEGPAVGLSAHGPDSQDRERSLGCAAIREEFRRLWEQARPAARREEPAVGLPAHGQDPEQPQAAHREAHWARSADTVREQLRGRWTGPDR